jgi:hypothetical protein
VVAAGCTQRKVRSTHSLTHSHTPAVPQQSSHDPSTMSLEPEQQHDEDIVIPPTDDEEEEEQSPALFEPVIAPRMKATPIVLPVAVSARRASVKRKRTIDDAADDDEELLTSVPALPASLVDCKRWHRSVVQSGVACLHKRAVEAKQRAEAAGQACYSLSHADIHPTAVRLFQLQLSRAAVPRQPQVEVTIGDRELQIRL